MSVSLDRNNKKLSEFCIYVRILWKVGQVEEYLKQMMIFLTLFFSPNLQRELFFRWLFHWIERKRNFLSFAYFRILWIIWKVGRLEEYLKQMMIYCFRYCFSIPINNFFYAKKIEHHIKLVNPIPTITNTTKYWLSVSS